MRNHRQQSEAEAARQEVAADPEPCWSASRGRLANACLIWTTAIRVLPQQQALWGQGTGTWVMLALSAATRETQFGCRERFQLRLGYICLTAGASAPCKARSVGAREPPPERRRRNSPSIAEPAVSVAEPANWTRSAAPSRVGP